jgi:hypothetical protein
MKRRQFITLLGVAARTLIAHIFFPALVATHMLVRSL